MRKKSHRALNKDDRSFDKFYLINYLEVGKRWTQLAKEVEPEEDEDSWIESVTAENDQLYCFFCDEIAPTYDQLLLHLYDRHDFEYEKIKRKSNHGRRVMSRYQRDSLCSRAASR